MKKEWTPEEEERALEIVRAIVVRRMAMPALLALEGMRPLHFVGGQFLHFVSPMSGLVTSRWDLDQLGNFLEHRDAVPFLIDEIQRLEKERESAERAARRARQQERAEAKRQRPATARWWHRLRSRR